jgi:hypothetical protein
VLTVSVKKYLEKRVEPVFGVQRANEGAKPALKLGRKKSSQVPRRPPGNNT